MLKLAGLVLPRLVVFGLVGVVVCLCLSVGFKVFSAMFFYMYENMAGFCFFGVQQARRCRRQEGATGARGVGGGEECEEVTGAQVHGQYPPAPKNRCDRMLGG